MEPNIFPGMDDFRKHFQVREASEALSKCERLLNALTSKRERLVIALSRREQLLIVFSKCK